MIKKIFLAIIISFVGISSMYSQCTPGSFNGPGFVDPDTSAGLPDGVATALYWVEMTTVIPSDTFVPALGYSVNLDSAGITSITGLPTGLSWVTNSATNYWPGGTKGCILISGIPSSSEVGNQQVEINVAVHGMTVVFPITLEYELEILDSIYIGINEKYKNDFMVFQNSPNPFSNQTTIKYINPKNEKIEFVVYNIIGEIVYKESFIAKAGINEFVFNPKDIQAGLYIYQLKNKRNTFSKKMIIE